MALQNEFPQILNSHSDCHCLTLLTIYITICVDTQMQKKIKPINPKAVVRAQHQVPPEALLRVVVEPFEALADPRADSLRAGQAVLVRPRSGYRDWRFRVWRFTSTEDFARAAIGQTK